MVRSVSQRGMTFIELIIAIVISVIALFGLAPLLISGTTSVGTGKRRAEAGRDTEMVIRAMARKAREAKNATIASPTDITFISPTAPVATPCGWRFRSPSAGQLSMTDTCTAGSQPVVLIDNVRSQVLIFVVTATSIVKGKTRLVNVNLTVAHQLRTTAGQRQNNETFQTDLYLRNA